MKIVLNTKGVRELLRSAEVEADVKRRADRVAAAAGEGFEAEADRGPNPARASVRTVTPGAMVDEATNHTLLRALDAGRG